MKEAAMEARAKLFGHPIHQMLIVLPLGLLAGVVLFDVLALVLGGDVWRVVAYWLIPAGVVTGLLAAVFGLIDWATIPRGTRARRVGIVHGAGNVLVVALFTVSWLLRGDATAQPTILAYALSFAGGGLSMLTGWLGGELVNRLGVGVDDGAHLDAPSSLSGRPASDTVPRRRTTTA
jgi:uncharacterized membrane protein